VASVLDDTVEHEAVTPFGDLRRAVWSWYLTDVVPRAHLGGHPATVCSYYGTAEEWQDSR
jgi:hypothetical protein